MYHYQHMQYTAEQHTTGQTELELYFKGQFRGTHITRKHRLHRPAPVQTEETFSCSIYSVESEEPFHSTSTQFHTFIVRNAICISVRIWIMGKHVITSARRLGIHPVLVFKLILQMPSAWHFCEEAGTPSRYRCREPPHGAEQAQSKKIFQRLIPAFLCPVPALAHNPPKVSFSLFTDRPEASDD